MPPRVSLVQLGEYMKSGTIKRQQEYIYILGPRAHFGWNIRISSSFWKPRVAIKLTKKLSDV